MNTRPKQKEMMLQWMKLHSEVARGRLSRKGESRKEMKELLEDLANTINAANIGPVKSSSEWLKTWKDWKMYVLKKETKRRNHGLGTGGGSPIKIPFSSLEEELLDFITPEAADLENIPQGGIDLYENIIETNPNYVQPIPNLHFEENANKLLHKRLFKNDQFLKTNTGLKTQSLSIQEKIQRSKTQLLSPETINIQKEIQKSNTQLLSPWTIHIQEETQKSNTQLLSPRTIHIQEETQKSNTQLLSPQAIHIQETQKSNTQLSYEMVNIQKEKLVLKKEEVAIQSKLLEVQRSILAELQQIRNTVDTFGNLE